MKKFNEYNSYNSQLSQEHSEYSEQGVEPLVTHTQKKNFTFRRILKILLSILLAVFIIINIYILAKLSNVLDTLQQNELALSNQDRMIAQIIDNSAEIRKTLDLPELYFEEDAEASDNEGIEEVNEMDSGANSSNASSDNLLFEDVQEIYQGYNIDRISRSFTKIIQDNNLNGYATSLGLTTEQKDTNLIIRYQGNIIATIHALYNLDSEIYSLNYSSSLLGATQNFAIDASKNIIQQLNTQLRQNINDGQKIYREISKIFSSTQIKDLFKSKGAYFRFRQNTQAYVWYVYNFAQQEKLYIELSKYKRNLKSNIEVLEYTTQTNTLKNSIQKILLNLDYNSDEVILAKKNFAKLTHYTNDLKFKKDLQSLGLSISQNQREDTDYYYLDILGLYTDEKIGALGILKSDGSYWTLDKDDIPIEQKSIFSIAPKKVIEKSQKENYLLVGSHNMLADTIIIAHVNEDNQIKLISIPRDLYYKGRKINWYFKHFSPNNFNKLLSNLVGLSITQYVYVDMYAFVTVINILGGINVTLDAPLIDPSYRIKVNGRISYLNLSEGEHYFNGIEALRVARSRNSTNDFDRARRQQAIIEGIQSKLNSVDKISTFLSIVKIMDKIRPYISTNVSSFEMAKMAQQYRNSVIKDRIVLSTANILYSTYSAAYEKGVPVSEIDPEERGQWILLPKNNNWISLQNYVESFIMR